tara:strand:+ start:2490 stop:3182 length:693 start_codon:yes stop_codon:yes gene_type:complete
MTTFDIIVCSILGLSMALSLFKGFIKELFSLLSYLGGFLMASKYQGAFSHILIETIPSMAIAKMIAFVIIYILTVFIISLMGKVVKGMLYSGNQLSTADRIMGMVVGLGRGAVIVIALTFPLQFFPKVAEKVTKGSQTAPYIAEGLAFLNINSSSLNFRNKINDSINLNGAKRKFNELKNLKNMTSQFEELKKSLPILDKNSRSEEKPLDNYSKDDLKKLNDILKSVEKK